MDTTPFRNVDTTRAPGTYVRFERVIADDLDGNYKDASLTRARLKAFDRGDWHWVGVRARAHVFIVRPGYGTTYTLDSPGLWGIESDSGEAYFEEVYREEVETLTADLRAIGTAAF